MFRRMAVCGAAALVVVILTVNPGIWGQTLTKKKKKAEPSHRQKKAEPAPQPLPYQPGEMKVVVKRDQHPVIRLAMAASGVTIVEFPAEDTFFAVHPPRNGELIEVEKSPSIKSDNHLVLRAGKDLMSMPGPAASISVQMRSGLIVTLWVYPVKMIIHQTHRCVISYDRDEIVEARRRAGLAVNLGDKEEREGAKASETAAMKPSDTAPAPTQPAPPATSADGAHPAPGGASGATASEAVRESQSEKKLKALRGMLTGAAANPKGFKRWTHEANGLSVSTQSRDLDDNLKVALVAVRNLRADEAIRLLTHQPDLVIQTLDDKNKIIQLERVKQLHTESTTSNNIIPANATVYFAIAFAPPALGKQQRLTVTVGQKNAADDPAIAGLSANK